MKKLLAILLVLLLELTVVPFQVHAGLTSCASYLGNPTPCIGLEDVYWNKTGLNVYLQNQSYAGTVRQALENWYRAIDNFTETYQQYAYLRQIYFNLFIQGYNTTSPDIEVFFVYSGNSNLCGEGCTRFNNTNGHFNSPVRIYVDTSEYIINSTLRQYVVTSALTHELGHALGLGHSSYYYDCSKVATEYVCSGDLMDGFLGTLPTNTTYLAHITQYPSSLDMYALGTIYGGGFLPELVLLPVSIPYEQYTSATQPTGASQNLQNEISQLQLSLLTLKDMYTALANNYTASKQNINRLLEQVSNLSRQISATNSEIQNLTAENSNLTNQSATFQRFYLEQKAINASQVRLLVIVPAVALAVGAVVGFFVGRRKKNQLL